MVMTSEVRIHLSYDADSDEPVVKIRDFSVRPGQPAAVFSNYETKPPSQYVIRNIGRSAIVERTPIMPPDTKSFDKNVLAELTAEHPEGSWSLVTAMMQKAEVVVSFVADA